MKIVIGGIAATLMSAAAMAQSTPPPPADPMASPPSLNMSAPLKPSGDANMSTPMSSADTGPMLVQKNGKWWNGDKMATKAEIAEYQRTHPQ